MKSINASESRAVINYAQVYRWGSATGVNGAPPSDWRQVANNLIGTIDMAIELKGREKKVCFLHTQSTISSGEKTVCDV